MSELNNKNTHFSLMVVVKDLTVLHGFREKVVKHKLSFLLLSVIAVLADSWLLLSQSKNMHVGRIERQIVFRCGPARRWAPADRHKSECRRKINESLKINMSKTDFGGSVTSRNIQQQHFFFKAQTNKAISGRLGAKMGGGGVGCAWVTLDDLWNNCCNLWKYHNTHKAQTCFRSAQQDLIVSSDGC